MQVFRQELNAFPLHAIFDQAAEEMGDATLADILKKYGVLRSEISDPSIWVSVEFVVAVVGDILRALNDDSSFIERAARRGISQRYMGPLYPLLVGFGSPMFVYGQLPRVAARFEKLCTWRLDRLTPGDVRLSWIPDPGAPRDVLFCRLRALNLGAVPTLFSLLPAQVSHPQCVHRGDSECVYDLRWKERPRRLQPVIGTLLGVGTAGAFAAGGALSLAGSGLLAPLLAVGGWAVGKVWTQRQELKLHLRDIEAHHGALERVTQRNEERYAELLEAKNVIEEKVEERTRELRITAQQLSQTLEKVRELDRVKTSFFSNVSHELRTPLTLVLGPLSQMAEGREPAGGLVRAVQSMQLNGQRLLELINQLLDLSKIDAGQLELERRPTDLGGLAARVVERFVEACAQRGVQLQVEIAELAPLAVDPVWIESSFNNLLANAVRFAASHISLRLRAEGSSIIFEVEDDGPGLSPEDLDRVFERFVQGGHEQVRQQGTGLGLAIARETARLHGGDIRVRSTPGQSTAFTLSLPRPATVPDRDLIETPLPDPGLPAFRIEARPLANLEWAGPDPNAPLIVLADDDPELREMIGGLLATEYRVRAATNGAEALRLIVELRPDVVVADVLMPQMDGYELCRALRKREDTRSVPVLLLTARGNLERIVEGFDAGADDYVTKPFHARELLARVGVQIRVRSMVSEMAHRERLVSLGVLAASLAHQVRSPLTAIVAGLPLLERRMGPALDQRSHDLLRAIIEGGEQIESLISDLMNLSRVDREAATRFQPAERVRACVRLLEARARSGVRIQLEVANTCELQGRPGDISHVFLNLIDNAVRAAEPSGTVSVRTYDEPGSFMFEVGDSGSGLPAGKEETVFALFYTTRLHGEGTGLGLAIARQVVHQHGGSITTGRSELGGARFTVRLPAKVAEA